MSERTVAPTDEEELFLDEPQTLPRRPGPAPVSIDELFPSEDEVARGRESNQGTIDWREMNALGSREAVCRPEDDAPPRRASRTLLVVALILAAGIAGFLLVRQFLPV